MRISPHPPVRAHERTSTTGCAIYTRKSSEKGLKQSFNSLDAQRIDCELRALIRRMSAESCGVGRAFMAS